MNIFQIIIADYLIQNKIKKVSFFQEIFLTANISIEVVLKVFILTFNRANIQSIK